MRKILVLTAAFLFNSMAYGLPANRESVETLLEVSGVELTTNASYALMEQMVHAFAKVQLKGEIRSLEQQRKFDADYAKFQSIARPKFTWKALKPLYVRIYQETFDQAEVEGLIAFYRSPAGVAYATKSPELVKKSIRQAAEVAASLMPEIMQAATASSANIPEVAGVSCPTMVPPQMPRQAIDDKVEGLVRAQVTIVKGAVTDVKIISGPEIFHESVIAALRQYKCSYSETAIEATQEFFFKVATQLPIAPPASKTP